MIAQRITYRFDKKQRVVLIKEPLAGLIVNIMSCDQNKAKSKQVRRVKF